MPFTLGGDFFEKPKPKSPIKIFTEKRKGKTVTVIKNVDGDLKALAKTLKAQFCCGGSVKDDQIELQGDHTCAAQAFFKKD